MNHLILDGVALSSEGRAENGFSIVDRMKVGKGAVIAGRFVVRGSAIIGEDCRIGPVVYIGPCITMAISVTSPLVKSTVPSQWMTQEWMFDANP